MKQQIFDWIRRGENVKAINGLTQLLKQNNCRPHLRMEAEAIQKDLQECLELLEKRAIESEDAQKSQDHLAAKMLDILEQTEKPVLATSKNAIALSGEKDLLSKWLMALMILASIILVAEIIFW